MAQLRRNTASIFVFLLTACSGRAQQNLIDAGAQDDANPRDAAVADERSRFDAFASADVIASDVVAQDARRDSATDVQALDVRHTDVLGHDTGTTPDSAQSTDAFAAPPANDECTGAVDISAGGTFTGTTCGATDTASTRDCRENSTGADVFFVVRNLPPRSMGYSYTLQVDSGFMIADALDRASSVCSISRIECLPGQTQSLGISVAGGGTYFYAVQRSEPGCGAFTLSVTPR